MKVQRILETLSIMQILNDFALEILLLNFLQNKEKKAKLIIKNLFEVLLTLIALVFSMRI